MRQKRVEGDVVEIPLGRDDFGYGIVLRKPLMAFFDLRTNKRPTIDEIVSRPIVWRIWVMNYAVIKGNWKIVGNVPLSPALREEVLFVNKDAISGELRIHHQDGTEAPATQDECEDLERAAVWDPEHVEDRLRDHFNGVPNKWAESMKL